jgi:4-hydroxy-tetrahydrodipicolinate synthase
MKISGLWIPLITPFYHGQFDEESTKRLIAETQDFADGYIACLSSGEGADLSEQTWREVITCIISATHRPVAVGILGKSLQQIFPLLNIAKGLGCVAAVVPTAGSREENIVDFFVELDAKTPLPIIIYNTEDSPIGTLKSIIRLDQLASVVAIKESSCNELFFAELLKQKKDNLKMSILQGMEHQLLPSKGCDGYLISLANVEPKLCRDMFENPTGQTNQMILDKFWEYNLGAEWYITIKAILYSRGTTRSAEQVKQAIKI